MAVAKTAPAWLVPGAEVYIVDGRAMDGYRLRKATVERLTATQAIVTNGPTTWRFRLDSLRLIGVDRYESPELAAADDPRVLDTHRREAVGEAMRPLTSAIEEYRRGARFYTKELPEARAIAEALRSAAQHALDTFPGD